MTPSNGKTLAPSRLIRFPRLTRAAYDAVADNRNNANHWAKATSMDADSALVSELPTMRNRIRHEFRNNPYAIGIARKFAHYVIGEGPSLQCNLENEAQNDIVESAWAEFCDNCDYLGEMSYAEMLHLGVRDLFPSGEYFRVFRAANVPGVSLRLLQVEADRISSPYQLLTDPAMRDGIQIDPLTGKKLLYWIAKWHPGNSYHPVTPSVDDYTKVAPDQLVHYYVVDRPEQSRGCPLAVQMLETFARMRRWDEATIAAAERAALFGLIMVTNSDLMLGDNPSVLDPEEWEIQAGMGVVAPPGYDVRQVQPEHPSGQYEAFKRSKISDCSVGVDMPYSVAAADSSQHNYASGRLDHQGWTRAVKVLRSWIGKRDCSKTFRQWYEEARAVLPQFRTLPRYAPPHTWRWPGFEHVDPVKEATAAETLLRNNLLSPQDYYAERGVDWRKQYQQIAAAKKLAKDLGIEQEVEAPAGFPPKKDEGVEDAED